MFTAPEILFQFLWLAAGIVLTVILYVSWPRSESEDTNTTKTARPAVFLQSRLVWNNLWRKPFRSTLLILSSAITAAMLFLSYFFINSMDRSLSAAANRFGADVMVVPKGYASVAQQMLLTGTASSFYMPESVVEKIRSIPEVQSLSPQLYLETFSGSCCQVEGNFPVVAFDPKTDFTLKPWLSDVGHRFMPNSVILGSEAGGKNAIGHLDNSAYREQIHLFHHPFVVSQVLYPTGSAADHTIYMDINKIRELRSSLHSPLQFPEHSVSVVLVKTRPGDEEFVKHKIERMLPDVSAVTGVSLRETVNQQLLPLRIFSYLMIGIVILMTGLQVMTLFSAVVSERKREIGMFRALGASTRTVYRFLLQEAGLAGLLGGAAGTIVTFVLLYDNRLLIRKLIHLPLLFPSWGLAVLIATATIGVTSVLSILAATVPVHPIVKQEPYAAIREGE
ncbi:ABC transporter permease [Effusibacillus dendaii]|uniref:Putative hemin transport system permease protein HrtB n=1 Tax=Effusibacillus dendaii TaxID=2743772 RepID=A0A7I8D4L3_9BACL|nr:ABC transporter permease [Effusibacillus dendaii]BCJ85058.1 ABC transporter permease [Effusibacillus dendaii]